MSALTDLVDKQTEEIELLRKALRFALEHGPRKSCYQENGKDVWTDRGCGCCSYDIQIPEDIEPLLNQAWESKS